MKVGLLIILIILLIENCNSIRCPVIDPSPFQFPYVVGINIRNNEIHGGIEGQACIVRPEHYFIFNFVKDVTSTIPRDLMFKSTMAYVSINISTSNGLYHTESFQEVYIRDYYSSYSIKVHY